MTKTGNRTRTSFFSRTVMRTGIVKTQTGAQLVLLVLGVLLILLAFYFFKDATKTPPQPTPEQVAL